MAKIIPLSDLGVLIKCLGMSTSTNANEVAAAMGRANAILTKHGFTWAELLGKQVQSGAAVGANANHYYPSGEATKQQVQKAFDTLRGTSMNPGFKDWFDDVERKWVRDGYLSPGQRAPLFKALAQYEARR